MTEDELIRLIDHGGCIYIGREPCSEKIHLLFYSQRDKQCFVAVEDKKTREIITILYIDYHKLWVISPQAMIRAEQAARNVTEGPVVQSPKEVVVPIARIILTLHISNSIGWKKVVFIYLQAKEYATDYPRLVAGLSTERIDAVITEYMAKKFIPGVTCDVVLIKLGNNGVERPYPFNKVLS